MTTNALEFESKQQSMSNKELIENVKKQISELAKSGGRSHRMCVPPQVLDTDMILSELVRRFELLQSIHPQSSEREDNGHIHHFYDGTCTLCGKKMDYTNAC
jgi:hypothetical protein